jgi:hypothetical protein
MATASSWVPRSGGGSSETPNPAPTSPRASTTSSSSNAIRGENPAREPGPRRAIVAVVDLPSQAYGRAEERHGIQLALAAAIDAYATARRGVAELDELAAEIRPLSYQA